jgi:transcriptional regulator with XRE-family HTH domain
MQQSITLITLSELIRQHRDRTAESYSEIARRAGLSKAKIGQLANTDQTHMPRQDTIEKLSKGLQLPLRVIQQAAMASAGITPENYDGEQRIDYLAAILNDLPPDDLEVAAVVIQALRDRRTERKSLFKPAPNPGYRQKNPVRRQA